MTVLELLILFLDGHLFASGQKREILFSACSYPPGKDSTCFALVLYKIILRHHIHELQMQFFFSSSQGEFTNMLEEVDESSKLKEQLNCLQEKLGMVKNQAQKLINLYSDQIDDRGSETIQVVFPFNSFQDDIRTLNCLKSKSIFPIRKNEN